jgi:hypothetical protein
MARKRWASLRYARLIEEVKADAEVASAVDVGASDTVSEIADGTITAASNTFVTTTFVANTDFQSFVANTNSYIATKADSSSLTPYLQVANAVTAITGLSDVDISGATDGQVLTYNSGNGTITATTVSGGGGGSGDVANSYLTSTYVANTVFQSALANTNAYIATVSATERSALANTNAYIASVDTAKLETTDVDYSMMLTQQGTLAVTTGEARWYAPYNIATNSIKAYVETAPVGSAISIVIKKNGTSAATPSISAGATSATEITSAITMNAGDYLTVDITAVGSTTAGANLNIVFKYKRT